MDPPLYIYTKAKAPPEQYKKPLGRNITKTDKNQQKVSKSQLIWKQKTWLKIRPRWKSRMSRKISNIYNSKRQWRNFPASLPCHFINPLKSELGKLSKVKLEKINQALVKHFDINQWKNSSTTIGWFKGIDNKKDCIYIKSDIRKFHPTISESILKNFISFAKEYHHILDEDVRIIDHCRKSLLLNRNEPWEKKEMKS